MQSGDLFNLAPPVGARTPLGPQAAVFHGFALSRVRGLLEGIDAVARASPFRFLTTPGGHVMSVAMTGCGRFGWVSEPTGYRYAERSPETGARWPPIPPAFQELAAAAAAAAGFPDFAPDACLVNRYLPGSRLTLHQDRHERDAWAPIVSVSLGLRATFLFGGLERADRPRRVALHHGDVVVWGGVDRLCYHGVMPLERATHPVLGEQRLNLTFRKVL